MRAHHRALASSQAFWRLLLHHSVRFHEVHAALMHIRKSHMLAQSTYRVVRGRGMGRVTWMGKKRHWALRELSHMQETAGSEALSTIHPPLWIGPRAVPSECEAAPKPTPPSPLTH